MHDLIGELNVPVVVVVRTSLGSVNHLLLTLEALQHSAIAVNGIVLNNSLANVFPDSTSQQHASTIELIREFSPVPVFGPVPFEKTVQTDWVQGVKLLAAHPEIQRLGDHLIGTAP